MDEYRYDKLTGLPSIFYFFDLAEEFRNKEIEAGEDPTMLFIDLNGMKDYNAKYGFAEGDRLICAMGDALREYFGDENASRFGGDHFAVLTLASGLRELLKKFMETCKDINNGRNLPLNIGVYKNSVGDVPASVAIDRAKMACDLDHGNKTSHYIYFDESMLEKLKLRQYIIENFDKALEEGWIQVYYQPIIRTVNGHVCDEESLARWIDPERGMLSPADFIPVLEDAKLIHKLDLHMLKETIKKQEFLKKKGFSIVPSSINLSRVDFEVCDIVEEVRRIVDDADMDRSLITIEITESVIGADFDYVITQIERFRIMGFKVWMDDFGSGFSSPDFLQRVQFNTVKFDMQFMRSFDSGEKSRIILTELIKLMIALDLETVVEGVETEEQVEFLREIGCTKLQGFYFCKPIPQEEILKRNDSGLQIGFENPEETGYYETLGKLNLYDLSFMVEGSEKLRNYFETMPICVIEYNGSGVHVIRSNTSHHSFIEKHFPDLVDPTNTNQGTIAENSVFMRGIRQCNKDNRNVVIAQRAEDGSIIHVLIKKIAENPVTGACAFVSIGLSDRLLR